MKMVKIFPKNIPKAICFYQPYALTNMARSHQDGIHVKKLQKVVEFYQKG
jgi:hypothetical protein